MDNSNWFCATEHRKYITLEHSPEKVQFVSPSIHREPSSVTRDFFTQMQEDTSGLEEPDLLWITNPAPERKR